MLRKLLLTSAILLAAIQFLLQSSGTLKGKMIDKEKKDPIPFATVVIFDWRKQVGGANSDFDGNYTIKPIPPGKYDVKATFCRIQIKMMITGWLLTLTILLFKISIWNLHPQT